MIRYIDLVKGCPKYAVQMFARQSGGVLGRLDL